MRTNTAALGARRKGPGGTAHRWDLSAALLALTASLFSCRAAFAQIPATCVISGTVLDGGSNPIVGTPVRIRTVSPTAVGNYGITTNDLTTTTGAGGTWSLTVIQGLKAQVDIPAVGIANDIIVPSGASCPAAFGSLTLYARGTQTPATIISNAGPSMGGDLTGTSPNPSVIALRGQALAAGNCTNGQARVYSSGSSSYTCQAVTTGGVTSVTGGTGITVTGTTTPTVAITAGGVTATQLGSGAAATNVGTLSGALSGTLPGPSLAAGVAATNVGALGGDLTGTLPSPSIAPGVIVNADVNAAAAIAWSKLSKTGAVPSDIGAEATTNRGAANGYAPLDATSKVPLANLPATTPAAHASTHAWNGTDPVTPASIQAAAATHTHAESDVTGLPADLADKLSKASGGTVSGNVMFNGSAVFNGATTFGGSFSPTGDVRVQRSADATSGAQQKNSNNLVLEGSVWNGSAAERRLLTWRNTPTGLNAGKLSLLGYSTDNVIGSEISFFDAATGAFNGNVIGNTTGTHTGAVVGNVTGNVSGTSANVTGTVTVPNGGTGATTLTGVVHGNGASAMTAGNVALASEVSGQLPVANGGTGQASANAGFNALSPLTTLGDLLYGGTSGAGTRLAGNTTTTRQFLSSTGNGSVSAAPALTALSASDIPVLDFAKITTGTVPIAQGGTGQTTAAAAYNALSPTTTAGDFAYANGAGTNTRLAGNATGTKMFLSETSGVPSFGALVAADIPNLDTSKITTGTFAVGFLPSLAGDTTGSITANTNVKIQNNAVLAGTPTDGQVYQWVAANSRFEAKTLAAGAVTSVSGSGGSTGLTLTGGPTGAVTLTLGGTLAVANGGSGQTTAGAAFNAFAPTTTLGDLIYANGAGTNTRLAGNTTTTKQFLTSTGTGAAAQAPAYATIVAADVPSLDASKITTGTIAVAQLPTLSGDTTGAINATVNGKLQGRTVASTAPSDLQYLGWNNGSSQWEPKTIPAASGAVLQNGTLPLTANWNAGNFTIQSQNSLSVFNVKAYGAKGDGRTNSPTNDAAMASGSSTLTCASCGFISGDVGKLIIVQGAAAGGASLVTTISGYTSGTQIALTNPNASGGAISSKRIFWGTDDGAAIASAVAAAAATGAGGGGIVQFDNGRFMLGATTLNLDGVTGVIIKGSGSRTGGGSVGTGLVCTVGSGNCIQARASVGLRMEGMSIRAENSAFAGVILKLGGNATNSAVDVVYNMTIDGGGAGACTGIDQTGAGGGLTTNFTVESVNFAGCATPLNLANTYVASVLNNQFQLGAITGTSIINPVQGTTIQGNTFEATSTGKGQALDCTAGTNGLVFSGNWMGDTSAVPSNTAWVSCYGNGLTFVGNYFGNASATGLTGIKLTNVSSGVSITGNTFPLIYATNVGIDGGGFAHTGVFIGANQNTSTTTVQGFTAANVMASSYGADSRWGIGTTSPDTYSYTPASGTSVFEVKGTTGASNYGALQLSTSAADSDAKIVGNFEFDTPNNTGGAGEKRLAVIQGVTQGTTAANRGGKFVFYTKADNGTLALAQTIDNTQKTTFSGGIVATVAAPTVSAGQVGYGSTTASTVGAAGGASALPGTPLGYLILNVGGTQVKVPYYNN